MEKDYLDVGKASDLEGKDRTIYRIFETSLGALTIVTIAGIFFASWLAPVFTSFFIITFDIYWLIKTAYFSMHLRSTWNKMRHNLKVDWQERLVNLKYDHIYHLVLLPFYKEKESVIFDTLDSISACKYDNDKTIIILAYEERAGEEAEKIAADAKEKYGQQFKHFLTVKHPKNIPGDMPGKGSNIAYAIERARTEILDKEKIPYENVIVSSFDIDTRPYPQYFLCLTWNFLTCERPYRSSFQPVPLYNNNVWDAPAFSRVVATSSTFWQMIQQERPETQITFSSHAMSFKAVWETGYWQRNIVSEDSRIFLNSFLRFNGDYHMVSLFYPVSMDANLAPTLFQTAKNVYKQQRRWAWGAAENSVYMAYWFLKNKKIALRKKIRLLLIHIEGAWSWATNPLIIFFLGWLPLALGGSKYNTTLISFNLPRTTSNLMTIGMSGLIVSAAVTLSFLPQLPKGKGRHRYVFMVLQWIIMPFTSSILGSFPAIDAQMRLMLGKYMGFWVTPKHRKEKLV